MKKFLLILFVTFLSSISVAQITLSVTSQDVSCFGGANGSATVTAMGGTPNYTFTWMPGGFSGSSLTGLAAGAYTVTVQDQTASTASTVVNINQPTALVSSTSFTNPTCFGMCNGEASVIASGGTGPYTYLWSSIPTQTTATVTNLCAGSYSIQVTDINNCVSIRTVNISQGPALIASITVTNVSCFGACDGAASAMINGGVAPYTYSWSPGISTAVYMPGACAGNYTFQVMDSNGCTNSQAVTINQPSPLTTIMQSNNASCGITCDGSIYSAASGGTPPYIYIWQPGGITSPMVNNLCPGTYSLSVTDANGCATTSTAVVMSTGNGSLTGVTPTLTVYNESCYLSGDGSLDLELSGSNPGPFTYQWNNGATTQDLTNVSMNYYTVMIFDAAMNCMSLSDTLMYDGTNCGTISGNLYFDSNSDCIKNSGDIAVTNGFIVANPGNRYAYPDAQGNFSFYSLPYGTYTLTSSLNAIITPTCLTNYTTSVNSSVPNSINNNFAFVGPSPSQPDMQVSAWSSGIVPGFVCTVNYWLDNNSLNSGAGVFKATLPSVMMAGFVSATSSYTISGDTIMWNFTNIGYYSYSQYQVSFTVPVGTPLGSTFTTCMWANTTVTDANPADNTSCYNRIVTGSFDPNDKAVSPVGTGPNGNITVNDKELTYLIRFQNTGNGPAVNIVVKDSISSNLDMSTFQMLNASHNYAIDVLPGNEIRWKFNNIMLPDSGSNEPGSHGFIQYRIKQKPNNPIGTQIKNTAYIYFDFNDPVITNTTLNTIAAPVGIMDISKDDNLWSVYPNPSNGLLHISSNTTTIEDCHIQVINAIGQVVFTETMKSNYKTIDLSKYNNGVYFIKMASDKNTSVKRIVLNK